MQVDAAKLNELFATPQGEKKRCIIRAVDVRKTYRVGGVETHALRGATLDIYANEYMSIMGPSGSGKSTLFNMIGGLDNPTEGEVVIDGVRTRDMNQKQIAFLRCKKIGFIFQTFNLLPRLSILENVALPLQYAGVSYRDRIARARSELESVGLGDRMQHRPNQLSGGQRQRAAIARALVNRPAILLADEPTGALDTHTGEAVLKLFEDIHSKGTTIIVVTHDPDVAMRCHRTVKIRDGLIAGDS
jgi:putative ABC transport system ATP-binding protein